MTEADRAAFGSVGPVKAAPPKPRGATRIVSQDGRHSTRRSSVDARRANPVRVPCACARNRSKARLWWRSCTRNPCGGPCPPGFRWPSPGARALRIREFGNWAGPSGPLRQHAALPAIASGGLPSQPKCASTLLRCQRGRTNREIATHSFITWTAVSLFVARDLPPSPHTRTSE